MDEVKFFFISINMFLLNKFLENRVLSQGRDMFNYEKLCWVMLAI
jgi:hypothetical protein